MDVIDKQKFVEIHQFLRKAFCNKHALLCAVIDKEFQVIKFLHEFEENTTDPIIDIASKHATDEEGMEILTYLVDNEIGTFTESALVYACMHGNENIVCYLIDKELPISPDCLYYAIQSGNFTLVEMLLETKLVNVAPFLPELALFAGHEAIYKLLVKYNKKCCFI